MNTALDSQFSTVEMGLRLRKIRKKKRLTQAQVSGQAGISMSFYGHIERGSRKSSVETLYNICAVLDIDAHYLIFGIQHRPVEQRAQAISMLTDVIRMLE